MVRTLILIGTISLMAVPGVSENYCENLNAFLKGKSDQYVLFLLSKWAQGTGSTGMNFTAEKVKNIKYNAERNALNPIDHAAQTECMRTAKVLERATGQKIISK